MIDWTEKARLRTKVPYKELLDAVRDELETIGRTSREARNEIVVEARRYNGFGYDAKITARLEPVDEDEYEYLLKVRYELVPTVVCIVCLLFWPILLFVLLSGHTTSKQMQRDINEAIGQIEHRYGKHRHVTYD
jgi:hypothetical protein